ncbi:hypothetical protein H2204_011921 [Knufia peltigerae]|uniref:YTH domain-containing protein n=1 Tax=Knufia peltigerae TaxID=1002370 RepID=A0AA38XUG5_9EURO|nr:hypothetical protein H2204_011921 [Knufia peltigerae]
MQNFRPSRSQESSAWEDSRSSSGLPQRTPSNASNVSNTRQRRPSTNRHRGHHHHHHALWVGNIPSNTTVMSLRDYFAEAAPTELLTISYNPDAKYAFVNFSTEAARIAAIGKAASQFFEGRRLDCRIRRDNSSRSTKVSYGLNNNNSGSSGPDQISSNKLSISPERPQSMWNKVEELKQHPESGSSQRGRDKYFILKSYSLEALYQSLATNVWHIPKRHVERLNHAFQTGSKVYFLFSVNGSGEFFGYASMTSEIRQQNNEIFPIDARPSSDPFIENSSIHLRSYGVGAADVRPGSRHRTLSTTSSDASYGSIHYEPERRRIIWEASHYHVLSEQQQQQQQQITTPDDFSPDTMTPVTPSESSSARSFRDFPTGGAIFEVGSPSSSRPSTAAAASQQQQQQQQQQVYPAGSELQHISEPCQIRWHSTVNLPFEEVRGLRNPWNENKEVHVARNVTAVEPDAGEILLVRWRRKDEARRFQHSQDAISKAWPAR